MMILPLILLIASLDLLYTVKYYLIASLLSADPGGRGAVGPKNEGYTRGASMIWTEVECKIPNF